MVKLNKDNAPYWWGILIRCQRPYPPEGNGINWRAIFADRQAQELKFSEVYSRDFAHGTTGHNQMMLVAALAQLIDFIVDNFELVPKE